MGTMIKPPFGRYDVVGIGNFTKQAWGYPISNKTPEQLIEATNDLVKHVGKPEQVYSEQEGAFHSPKWTIFISSTNDALNADEGVHIVERFSRTL